MMQSCASAAKLRAAGPFFRSASSAMFEYGFPPPRIVNSAVVLKSQRAPNGAEWCARSGKPFQDAGRKTTPPPRLLFDQRQQIGRVAVDLIRAGKYERRIGAVP